jgi:ribosome-associated protein
MENKQKDFVEKIVLWAQDKKAEDIQFYDVIGKTDYTDGIILCHGSTELHVKAIAEHIIEKAKEEKVAIMSVEGMDNGVWILIDFVDIVVHIFEEKTRDYYQLEDLFSINSKNKKELVSNHVEKQD